MDKWKIDSAGGNLIVGCVISTTLVYGLGLFNLIGVEFGSMGCFFSGLFDGSKLCDSNGGKWHMAGSGLLRVC